MENCMLPWKIANSHKKLKELFPSDISDMEPVAKRPHILDDLPIDEEDSLVGLSISKLDKYLDKKFEPVTDILLFWNSQEFHKMAFVAKKILATKAILFYCKYFCKLHRLWKIL